VPYTPAAFVESAKAGRADVVRLFLDAGMDPDTRDARGVAAISWAIAGHHVETVRALVARGAALDVAPGNDGMTLLMLAAQGGDVEIVRVLLEGGMQVDAQDGFGNTALMHAVAGGHRAIVTHLLAEGADPNKHTRDSGATALGLAAVRGDADTVALLLVSGADAEVRERSFGMTPLAVAAFKGHLEVARALVERGADTASVDRDGQTPLAIARAHGNAAVAQFLADASVEHVTHDGTGVFRREATFEPPRGWVLADPFTDKTPFFLGRSRLRNRGGPAGTRRALLRAPKEIGAQAFLVLGPRVDWWPLLRAELQELETHPLVQARPLEPIRTADDRSLSGRVFRMQEGVLSGEDVTYLLATVEVDDVILIVDAGGPTDGFPLQTIVTSLASLDLTRDLGIGAGPAPNTISRTGE
jgi:ankyrin repeat protein